MRRILLLMFTLLSPVFSSYAVEPRSATLDALSAAMEQGNLRAADLSKVFDGSINRTALPVRGVATPDAALAAPARAYRPFSLPVPVPELVEKINTTSPI